jgi:hypothetical protein
VVNYRNRESAYRGSNHSWAKQVRQKSYSDYRADGQRGETRTGSRPTTRGGGSGYNPGTSHGREAYTSPQNNPRQTWNRDDNNRTGTDPRQSWRNDTRSQNTERYSRGTDRRAGSSPLQGRLPSGYQSPVTRPPSYPSESSSRASRGDAPRFGTRPSPSRQPAVQAPLPPRASRGEGRSVPSQAPPMRSREATPQPGIQGQERGNGRTGLRSLGEG